MTTISLAEVLEKAYGKPVKVVIYRVISTVPRITLEVEIHPLNEQPSKTFVEITL
jgi:hypothetical protein